MSLRDGKAKMSKSDPSDYSRINMTDDADTIRRKIQKATTDPQPAAGDARRGWRAGPEAANLLGIYAALADETLEAACTRFAGAMFSIVQAGHWPIWRSPSSSRSPPRCAGWRPIPAHLDRILADGRRAGARDRRADPARGLRRRWAS